MATQHDDWTPPVDGSPAVAGASPCTLSSRGGRHLHRPLDGWVGNNAGEGGKTRVFDCAIGVQNARASHVRQLATNVARPAREKPRTVTSARDADGDNRNRSAVKKVYYHKRLNVFSPISKTRDPVNPLK